MNKSINVDLRILRMWHWREAMRCREKEIHGGKDIVEVRQHRAKADFHIKIVQSLNDAKGCMQTTAEQDCEDFKHFLRALP